MGTRAIECERRYTSLAAVLLLLPFPCLLFLQQQQLLPLLLVGARQPSGTVPIVCVANLYMNIETRVRMMQTSMQAREGIKRGAKSDRALNLWADRYAYRTRLKNHLWCRCRLLMHIEELLGDFERAKLIASKESFVLKSRETRL